MMNRNKFMDEILEQPGALRKTLNHYISGEGKKDLERAVNRWKSGDFSKVVFTGMGSSWYVSNSVVTHLNQSGINAESVNAAELLHYRLPVLKTDTLLVCISQSGESFEIVKILEKLPSGISCIGICNEAESTLSKRADTVLLCKAGREEMTSTKTFVTTSLVAAILALALADRWLPERIIEIEKMIDEVEEIILHPERYMSASLDLLRDAPFIQLTGRGPSFSAVQQGALMFMEGARHPASALFSGEFRHGPMESVCPEFRAVIVAPDGITFGQNLSLVHDILKFGGKTIVISNRKMPVFDNRIVWICIPAEQEYLFSIPAVIPLQFIVNEWALEKGHIPGDFIQGAKITTNE